MRWPVLHGIMDHKLGGPIAYAITYGKRCI